MIGLVRAEILKLRAAGRRYIVPVVRHRPDGADLPAGRVCRRRAARALASSPVPGRLRLHQPVRVRARQPARARLRGSNRRSRLELGHHAGRHRPRRGPRPVRARPRRSASRSCSSSASWSCLSRGHRLHVRRGRDRRHATRAIRSAEQRRRAGAFDRLRHVVLLDERCSSASPWPFLLRSQLAGVVVGIVLYIGEQILPSTILTVLITLADRPAAATWASRSTQWYQYLPFKSGDSVISSGARPEHGHLGSSSCNRCHSPRRSWSSSSTSWLALGSRGDRRPKRAEIRG